MRKQEVLVLGGGVAGLSAAHELAERGFAVTVLERRPRTMAGGKARSYKAPGRRGPDHLDGLPAEHGFRFFPGFYKHLPDTMRRIPFRRQPDGVLGNLVEATETEVARGGGQPGSRMPSHFPETIIELREVVDSLFGPAAAKIPAREIAFFTSRLLLMASSCDERRYAEWDRVSWWDFTGADSRSPAYQKYLVDGIVRKLVAARAREMSARTAADIYMQLFIDRSIPGKPADRVLNGPTNEVWINPWLDYLQDREVTIQFETTVEAIHCEDHRVTGIRVKGAAEPLQADWYVSAVPVEEMAGLVSDTLVEADPGLANVRTLAHSTRWMNGFQLYLRRDNPIVRGHVICIDSAWSLTLVSQRQFWRDDLWPDVGFRRSDSKSGEMEKVEGVLSVDISDWETPGMKYGKPAKECTAQEIRDDVLEQLRDHLGTTYPEVLSDANIADWSLDADIVPERDEDEKNLEPLLVNTAGSWVLRPEATTRIDDLFLASDYVRTFTDLATMEGANEAARRAVNGILVRSGVPARPCRLWPLRELPVFAPLRKLDEWRFRRGLPPRPHGRVPYKGPGC